MRAQHQFQKLVPNGYSILELLVVITLVTVMATFTLLALNGRRLHDTDDQAYLVLDFLKEARQRAITQRETMRVEINRDTGTIRLINENGTSTANDDEEIRRLTFSTAKGIVYDRPPDNMAVAPTAVTPIPSLVFKASVHPTSTPDMVGTVRFFPNGRVMDAGSNDVGDNATVKGATIYFWSPLKDGNGALTNNSEVLRAITIIGASGNTRFLKCPIDNATCAAWNQ